MNAANHVEINVPDLQKDLKIIHKIFGEFFVGF